MRAAAWRGGRAALALGFASGAALAGALDGPMQPLSRTAPPAAQTSWTSPASEEVLRAGALKMPEFQASAASAPPAVGGESNLIGRTLSDVAATAATIAPGAAALLRSDSR